MSPDLASARADEGQDAVEREQSYARVAWAEWDKTKAAINAAFTVRSKGVTDDTLLRLEYSVAHAAHKKTMPTVPRPTGRTDLHLVPADHTGYRPYWGE